MSYEAQTSWFLPCFGLMALTESRLCFQGAIQAAAVSHRSWSTHDAECHQSWYEYAQVSSHEFCTARLFRLVVLSQRISPESLLSTSGQPMNTNHLLRGLRCQSSDPDVAIMVSRCDLQSVNMQVHIASNVGQLETMIVFFSIDLPEQ